MLHALLILLIGVASWADPPDVDFRERAGKSTTEALKWYASGTVPGTLGVTVDTLIGDLNKTDTTVGVDIAGASRVAVVIRTARKSSNTTNVLASYQAQVADSNGTAAEWHTITSFYENPMVYSVATSAADTLMWVFLVDAYPDTLALDGAPAGVTVCTHAGQAYVRNSRFLRLIGDPTCYAGDTLLTRAAITKTYPR